MAYAISDESAAALARQNVLLRLFQRETENTLSILKSVLTAALVQAHVLLTLRQLSNLTEIHLKISSLFFNGEFVFLFIINCCKFCDIML